MSAERTARGFLPRLAWDHPVSLGMAFIALLVLGAIAWVRIPLQMFPDGFEPKFLFVLVPYGNGTPVETDERVVRPITDQLATVPGIHTLTTDATVSEATFEIEFQPDTDMAAAYGDVTDRLERAMPDLPDEVQRWFIFKFNPDQAPILWAGIQIPPEVGDEHALMTRVVQPRIERVPGVARLDLWGTNQRAVWIDWDRDRLQATGANLAEVVGALRRDNFQMPGGTLIEGGEKDGRVLHVRSIGWIRDLHDLQTWPIPGSTRGRATLSDIADIQLRKAASTSIGRINGLEAASFGVSRESSANTVSTAAAVKEALKELEADPRLHGARFFVFFDQGDLIEGSLNTLLDATLQGGLFAVLILWLFLREWRMTLLIALSIPYSLLMTVSIQFLRGDSLNLLSLMGLMLAVGMVVDNAIVVVETILQHRAAGLSARQAAIEGTGEVNLAILSSTATSMVVFLPIILMSGSAEFSFFMGALGFPVVFALAASVVVALLFAPLATRLVQHVHMPPPPRWMQWVTDRYAGLLRRVLEHPFDSGVALTALLVLTVALPVRGVSCSPEPGQETDEIVVRIEIPPQSSYADRDAIVKRFERYAEEHREAWGIDVYRVRLAGDENVGRLNMTLARDAERDYATVVEEAQEALPKDLPGVEARIGRESGSSGDDRTLTVTVGGEDMGTLTDIAREVARRAETVDGVLGADFGWAEGGTPEIRLDLRPDALDRYGLTGQGVGQTLAFALRGLEMEPIRQGRDEITVNTRFAVEDRADARTLGDFPLYSPAMNGMIPLRSVVDVGVGRGPATVHRVDGRTAATVRIDLDEKAEVAQVGASLDAALDGMNLPDGYTVDRSAGGGWDAEEDRAMYLAMFLSVAFVFLIMGMLFESLLLPLAIILTVPLAMLGAWWALWLTDTSMDLMAGVGLVILVGVIVNNGIVLIDIVSQLRHDGLDRTDALVEAGRRRLRPIAMTALTTIIGLVPMAFGDSAFVGIPYAPLGRTVMGGMVAGTLLTLVFVPWLYALLDGLKAGAGKALAAARARGGG